MRSCLVALGMLMVATPCWAKFDPAAWQKAAASHRPDWSREEMASQLPKLDGMARQQVLALLGEPGFSERDFYPANMVGGDEPHFDEYRLSARNDGVLTVEYDDHDAVKSASVSDESCDCPSCSDIPQGAVVTRNKVSQAVIGRKAMTIRQIDALLGAGKHAMIQSRAGGRYWANISDAWRVADQPYLYLVATGHIPLVDFFAETRDPEAALEKAVLTDGYAYITAWPDCLPRVRP